MTAEREELPRTTQRRMLRWMLGSFWKRPTISQEAPAEESSSSGSCSEPDEEAAPTHEEEKMDEETWVQWMQRCTHTVEGHWARTALDDWSVAQRRREWRLAGHTARRDDNRWSETLLGWEPPVSNRERGHPPKRWTNDSDTFFHHLDGTPQLGWKLVPRDRARWQSLEDDFVHQAWYRLFLVRASSHTAAVWKPMP